jgi:hypothetical protein
MAPNTQAPRRLDEAPRPGGLYYTADGTAVDAHGNVLENAPERQADTPPHEQPFAKVAAASASGPVAAAGIDAKALGEAIAAGLVNASARREANADATTTATTAREGIQEGAEGAQIDKGQPPVGDSTRTQP